MGRGAWMIAMGIIFITKLQAQQTPVYTQYMFNKFLTNPAIAGSEGYTAVNLTAREQWVGIEGAPRTNSISYQTRINSKRLSNLFQMRNKYSKRSQISNVGLGMYLYNDHRGLIDQTGLQLTYAYHLEMEDMQLSFGLTTSFTQYKIDRNKLELSDSNDHLLDNTKLNALYPDFNFGVYITTPEYYAGASVSDMVQSAVRFENNGLSNYRKLRNYNFSGGYRFKVDKEYSIEPSINFKSTEQFANQLDVVVRGYYENNYWCGIGYRTGGAFVAMAGIRYANFYFGYAYDYSTNALQSSTIGSHEIMITYKLGKVNRKFKWLERF